MHSYAQTNIQLFNQLRCDGYSNTEIGCIFNAYKLAMCLFTGCFRPSGKTFIAHLVGTASILSFLHLPAEVVATGLIHAAYASCDFGNGEKGISDAKREQIRRAVGEQVEEYVARYKALKWNEHTIPDIRDRLDTLKPIDRNVLLIRLANELEEHLDLGLLYCGDGKHRQYVNHSGHLMVEMAEKLGFPTLAIELARVFKETASGEIPIELRNQTNQNSSFLIVPKSYQRLYAVLHHWLISGPRYLLYAVVRKLSHLLSTIGVKTKFHAGSKLDQG